MLDQVSYFLALSSPPPSFSLPLFFSLLMDKTLDSLVILFNFVNRVGMMGLMSAFCPRLSHLANSVLRGFATSERFSDSSHLLQNIHASSKDTFRS